MELLEAIKTRRSIRDFTGERIPDEHIEMILDAARYAPSPENLQMWRYVVIREDQEMKDLIAELSMEVARQVFGAQPYARARRHKVQARRFKCRLLPSHSLRPSNKTF